MVAPPNAEEGTVVDAKSERDDGLAEARDVLTRTVQFLAGCAADPDAALKAQDPRELIRELEGLLAASAPQETSAPQEKRPDEEIPKLPVRRRRSA